MQVIHATWSWGCYASLSDTIPETYRVEECGHYDAGLEQCEVQFVMPNYMPSSVYSMNHITMFDQAENTRGVYFTVSGHGLRPEYGIVDESPRRIELVTDHPDLTLPELDVKRISIIERSVRPKAPDGETVVKLTYHVRDDGSGYGIGWYYLRDPQGVDHHHYAYRDPNLCTNEDASGWITCTDEVILPRGFAPGVWGLAEMVLRDKAGNVHRYDFTEIVHVDVDCEREQQMSDGEVQGFEPLLVAAVTKVTCLPTFEVAQ